MRSRRESSEQRSRRRKNHRNLLRSLPPWKLNRKPQITQITQIRNDAFFNTVGSFRDTGSVSGDRAQPRPARSPFPLNQQTSAGVPAAATKRSQQNFFT